jgi:uncharacterized protein with HEPN domain
LSRSLADRCDDIITAIDEVTHFAELAEVSDAKMVESSVRDGFSRIGDAVNHLPDEITSQYPHISWDGIVGMRIVGSHIYFKWDSQIAMNTIHQNLPELRAVIVAIRDSL